MASPPRFVVVGAGPAGMAVACDLVDGGAQVDLVSREGLLCQAPTWDGLNAAPGAAPDQVERHAQDALRAGQGRGPPDLVRAMARAAPALLELLVRAGVPFRRDAGGQVARVATPGHQDARTAWAGPDTGPLVARALASRVLARQETGRLRRHVGWEVVDLVVDDAGACRGVVAIHTVTLAVETWEAHGVCACPGGYAGLWPRSTSPGRRGELLWACVRRGARLVTPEAAHFHPLVAAPPAPPRPWPWLALAGRGALTVEGEPVAHQGESPHAVTGAILRACQARGLGPVGALLAPDLDGLASPPGAASGHGTAAGPFRVAPAVTRTLGGLEVGWRVSPRGEVEPSPLNGQTALPGLYAAGQVCGGLHGDCALPGDESLATLFTARLAARGMLVSGHKGFRLGATSSREAQAVAETTTQALRALSGCGGEENPFLLGDEAARVVGHAAGLLRCREDLEAGRAQLGGIQQRRLHAATPDAASVLEAWGLDARLALADRVLEAALARPESLGAEQRGDAPGDVTPAADGSAT